MDEGEWRYYFPDPVDFRAFALLLASTDPVPGVGYLYTLNPLNPKSDPTISPYNISPESYVKATRIKEMITKERIFWLVNKFSSSAP